MKKALVLPVLLDHIKIPHLAFAAALLLFLLLVLNMDELRSIVAPKALSKQVTCDVQHNPHQCEINTHLGPIEISTRSEIISLEPFTITLKAADKQLKQASIRFEGLEDYMGINHFEFTAQGNNTWQAKGTIPICTTQSKLWKVIVSLSSKETQVNYWFKMKTR